MTKYCYELAKAGMRMRTQKFRWQKMRKEESNTRIFKKLATSPRTFTELLSLTGLSRGVLGKRLKEMLKKGLVEKFVADDGHVKYRLMGKAAQDALSIMKIVSFLTDSSSLFLPTKTRATDAETDLARFLEAFVKRIGAVALYTLIHTLTIENPREAERWLESTFAYPDQRIDWLRCLMYRAAFEAEKKVDLGFGESYDIARILQQAPREMIPRLWKAYRTLYPDEAHVLDNAMNSASRYSNVLRRLQKGELDMKDIEKLPFREVLEKYG